MTIARRSLEDGAATERHDTPVIDRPLPGLRAARPAPAPDWPNVPLWALVVGLVLVLVFAGLVFQTFTGRSLLGSIVALAPGSRVETLAAVDVPRTLYVPGAVVEVGQVGLGTRGQDRPFQPGDVVLLGATGKLVRLEANGSLTELRAPEGTVVQVASLGVWDPSAGSLAGVSARSTGQAWTVDAPQLQSVSAPLHVPDAPEEDLTVGFRLAPPTAGRVRRFEWESQPGVRIRPNGRASSLVLESWDPLPTLDDVPVTVQATVRASEGANLELALNDVVDAAGTVQQTVDRRKAGDEDEWLTLRVQRRVIFGSPDDRFGVGLLEVRNRDWLEVRDLGVYLGILP